MDRAAARRRLEARIVVTQASTAEHFFGRTPCSAGQTLERLARSVAAQLKTRSILIGLHGTIVFERRTRAVRCSDQKLFAKRAGSDVDDGNETRRYFHGRHFATTPPLAAF